MRMQPMITPLLFVTAAAVASVANAVVPGSSSANEINHLQKRRTFNLGGALYPQASETRDLKELNGIWNFRKSPVDPEFGYRNGWYEQDLDKTGPVIPMPVPSSYNDVGEDASLRDHVGLVWYDRRFFVPSWWTRTNQRVWLRFSSVHYAAQVWVNGKAVTFHEIGHLPFEVEITDVVHHNSSNLLTVAVDNTLLSDTIPQGSVSDLIPGNKTRQKLSYTFDFFNYAGIHRTVFLYSTPQVYIDDVIVNTDIQGLTGFVVYNVTFKGPILGDEKCLVQLYDKNELQVAALDECAGLMEVPNANFWWPHLMHSDPGYLYTFKASVIDKSSEELIDTYVQKIGIRTVTWSNSTIYLNEKPVYMRGFGMHEDSDLRGKGWDPVLWVKNFNLIRWVGANAFRTSHYPYAEEIYQMADEQGIMIIDECPSGDTDIFSDKLLIKHKQSLTELIRRDKNHPSVIAWSIANEPRTSKPLADAYFQEVVRHVKSMDLSRPVTAAIAVSYSQDRAARHLDVISFNRYNAWYEDTGNLLIVTQKVIAEATAWYRRHNKPVLMSEYGADTVPGLHRLPEYVWSEEYQVALMSEHFKAFDKLRRDGFFNGEFIWNFADFMTAQTYTRVGGNKKGIFTRQRQPKSSAHHLRARYLALAAADSGAASPDTSYYVSDHRPAYHEEL
ncbi:hypothetical protein O0L34_g6134 [Tuta absoluta]|nr:hypothetical protein O0L34_g6134 [Tuta absoluta]